MGGLALSETAIRQTALKSDYLRNMTDPIVIELALTEAIVEKFDPQFLATDPGELAAWLIAEGWVTAFPNGS